MKTRKHFFLLFFTALLWGQLAEAKLHSFFGVNRNLKDVQNSNGGVEDKPFSPTLSLGYNFDLSQGYGFSPQLGYIHTTQVTRDSYGDQKVHTIFLNWDFIKVSSLFKGLAYRFGIGNFVKRTSGEGGTVQIPNGTTTSTARRPGATVNSYSNTFDFGLDYKFGMSASSWYSDLGARFELYVFRPLSQDYRSYSFNLGLVWYF